MWHVPSAPAEQLRSGAFLTGQVVIVVKLMGGLGNQMFQYAAGRRLAMRRATDLKLDLGAYKHSPNRAFALSSFPIAAREAEIDEVRRLTHPTFSARIIGRLLRRPPRRPASLVVERGPAFDPSVLALPNEVYLAGYWQSERYFADAGEVIRTELRPADPLDATSRRVAEAIDSRPALSVHVRRGDYVTSASARETHGTCSPDYYRRAAAFVANRVEGCHAFVFSDEPDWARDHLDLGGLPVTIVADGTPRAAAADLALMVRCRHHVVANSSFSWWGAWLSGDPGRIVVAPRRWFASADFEDRDLVPRTWSRL